MVLKISDGALRGVRPVALAALGGMGVEVSEAVSDVRGLHGERSVRSGPCSRLPDGRRRLDGAGLAMAVLVGAGRL
jgi:hypothetical protein